METAAILNFVNPLTAAHTLRWIIQNGGRFHGNQGAKNVKFTPNSGSFGNLTQK
jgi:hypothetical protein